MVGAGTLIFGGGGSGAKLKSKGAQDLSELKDVIGERGAAVL